METERGRARSQVVDRLIDTVVARCRDIRFPGKGRLAELIVPKNEKRNALIFGSWFSLDTSDFLQRHIYAGSFERKGTETVCKFLRPGMTFVDVGANVGYYTALAARLVGPTGSVFAFEPSDYAFPRLTKMIEMNHLTNASAIKCALAERAGDRFLYGGVVDEEAADIRTATMVPSDNPRKALVRTETLDRMAEELNIRHIDFMKIDVDGLEPLVLQGADTLISQGRISNIMLECAEYWFKRMNTCTAELIQRLREKGYSNITLVEGSSEFCSYLFRR